VLETIAHQGICDALMDAAVAWLGQRG
jgi:hypothetical protein